jgi:universal stress protein E
LKIKSAMVVMAKPKHKQFALDRAKQLQQSCGARLRLVSFCWNAMCEQSDVFDVHQRRAIKAEIMRDREAWLIDQVRDAGMAAADVSIEVQWTDNIAGWVSAKAAANEFDLVLKSVHRSRTLVHTPLDWQLLEQCSKPVYISAPPRRSASGNVLAALDFRHRDRKHQALNMRVLEAAQEFADMSGGKLHCVNVVEFSQVLSDLDLIDPRSIKKKALANNREVMNALLEPFDVPKSRMHTPLGKVGQMIATTARKIDADLLVIGTSTRRKGGAVLIGNSAQRTLEKSPCDVLAVHP